MPERAFTTSEAAAVTEQPVNRIQKFIDAGPIPRRHATTGERAQRVLDGVDLLFLWVVRRAFPETDLDARQKQVLYEELRKTSAGVSAVSNDEIALSPFVTVRGLTTLSRELRERVARLERAHALVHSDPEVRGGEPVIRGTRVPVYLVAEMLDQGASAAELLDSYPSLTEEHLELARVYARATPRRGRPPKRPWR
ncbi:MAG: DUF433 domain-containing protein [Planctomycetes bacterium]|nr:DUF433 domain-containing protein [Planctomycetota bacterium]